MKNNGAIGKITNKVTLEEIATAIGLLKLGKFAGCDGLLPEILSYLGPRAQQWLANVYTISIEADPIPEVSKQAQYRSPETC